MLLLSLVACAEEATISPAATVSFDQPLDDHQDDRGPLGVFNSTDPIAESTEDGTPRQGSVGSAVPTSRSSPPGAASYDSRFNEVQVAWGRPLLAPDKSKWGSSVSPRPDGAKHSADGHRVQVRFWPVGTQPGSGSQFYSGGGLELGVTCSGDEPPQLGGSTKSVLVRGFDGTTTAYYRGDPPSNDSGEIGGQDHDLRFISWRDGDRCLWRAMLGSRAYALDQAISILNQLLVVG